MKFTKEEIKGATVGAIVGAAVFLCVSLSTSIEKSKSSATETIKVDTVLVHDTVEVIKTEKVYIKPKPSREIDYVYLHSTRWELSEKYRSARTLASLGTRSSLREAKAVMKEAKKLSKQFNEYKSHLIYVD